MLTSEPSHRCLAARWNAVDYNKCIIDRSRGLADGATSPRSGASMNTTRKAWLVPVLAAAAVCWGSTLAAQDKDEQEGNQAAVAKAVLGARVPLERGLAASASHGRPISAKFEMEEGKLQLSAYTMKDGKFFEVIVDHNTGKVVKAEPIAEGEDYTASQSQSAAMAKTKGQRWSR